MEQAVEEYRRITTTSEFRERERLRSRTLHNEASALYHAREEATEQERKKWQGVVAEKDAALAEQSAALANKDALIAKLLAQLDKDKEKDN